METTENNENPKKVKKVILTSRKFFIANKDYLCRIGANFEYHSSGSVNKIVYGDREFTSIDLKTASGKGYHLNKMFMNDIDNWILNNAGAIEKWDNNYKEQMFNLDAIEKNTKKLVVSIDINDCYWRTAYKLGYITEETYIIGKRKKAWKTGRNACIGSLVKTKTIMPFVNGKMDRERRRIIRTPIEYQYIRNHIIGHVYKMFNTLFEQIGDSFFMFLTDCLFTTYDKQKQVEEYFMEEGYRVKSKAIEFTAVDRKEKKVSWYDFEGTKKNEYGKIIQTGVDRYYLYSNAQTIQSSLISTRDCFK